MNINPILLDLYPPNVKWIPNLDMPVVTYGTDTSNFLLSNFPLTEIIPGLYSVTIPRGTLLYHSANIPKLPTDENMNNKLEYIIKLLKGTTPYGTRATYLETDRKIKLTGCHDQFNFRFLFFSIFPTIEFLLYYNYIIEYETKHDIKLAIAMSPSRFTKKGARSEANTAIYRSCAKIDKETNASQRCTDLEILGYDTCFTLDFLQEHSLSGQLQISYEESNKAKVDTYTSTRLYGDGKLPDELIKYKRKLTYGTFSADNLQKENNSNPQYGPPEVVLYQFGPTAKSNFEYTIDVEEDNPEKTLMKHLLNGESEQIHPLLQIRSIISHDRVIDFKERTQVPKYVLTKFGEEELNVRFPFLGREFDINFPMIPQQKYNYTKRLFMMVNYFTKYQDIENQIYVDPRLGSLIFRASEPTIDDGRKFSDMAIGSKNFSQSVYYRLETNPLPIKLDGRYGSLNDEIKSSLIVSGGGKKIQKSRRRFKLGRTKKSIAVYKRRNISKKYR